MFKALGMFNIRNVSVLKLIPSNLNPIEIGAGSLSHLEITVSKFCFKATDFLISWQQLWTNSKVEDNSLMCQKGNLNKNLNLNLTLCWIKYK